MQSILLLGGCEPPRPEVHSTEHRCHFQRISRCSMINQDCGLSVEAGEWKVSREVEGRGRNQAGYADPSCPLLTVCCFPVPHSSHRIWVHNTKEAQSQDEQSQLSISFESVDIKIWLTGERNKISISFFVFKKIHQTYVMTYKEKQRSWCPLFPSLHPHEFTEGECEYQPCRIPFV